MNEKWKVHKIKTDCEPWLFLDGWEKDIIETIEFDHKKEALEHYTRLIHEHQASYRHVHMKKLSLFTFWNDCEKEFCEACDDDLQIFHGVLFMKGEDVYDLNENEEGFSFVQMK
ncbi:DUF1033 family protein [Priestia flexa]|uniref:DUF1033 family protein n=1 Tax=Priestia flexa TaxID=86664 RepID=A0A1N6Q8I0_9BACI|nr:DUF1033 family protein [Priestia flexa]MBN8252258.1 DUF1033 family protein [Priestia flexa]MBY6085706.1 DUF1033 family protein [Priestia flexa]MCA1201840.1 DUF1033 family protein [Priestia flexa]MCG7313764.1 DUF1033 family protein [Priestia flexa]MCP1189585.1 DUF1033 family protein [Priestia flexa]